MKLSQQSILKHCHQPPKETIYLLVAIFYYPQFPQALATTFCLCVLSCSVVSDPLWPFRLWPTRLLCPQNFTVKNTEVSSHSLLQGIFLTQGLDLGLLRYSQIPYLLSHHGCFLSIDFSYIYIYIYICIIYIYIFVYRFAFLNISYKWLHRIHGLL